MGETVNAAGRDWLNDAAAFQTLVAKLDDLRFNDPIICKERLAPLLEAAKHAENHRAIGVFLSLQASCERFGPNPAESFQTASAAVAVLGEFANEGYYVRALNILALSHLDLGDSALAMENLVRALNVADDLGLGVDAAFTCINLGYVYDSQGRCDLSMEYYRRIEERYKSTAERRTLILTHNNIANALNQTGRYDEAEPYVREGLAIVNEDLEPILCAHLLSNQGVVLASQGRGAEAMESASRAENLFRIFNGLTIFQDLCLILAMSTSRSASMNSPSNASRVP